MNVKKIYWCLQQLDKVGGTEMVTLQIINLIKDEYEIHLIPFGYPKNKEIPYKIPEGVIVENINFPYQLTQFDVNLYKKLRDKKYFSALGFIFKMVNNLLFGRFKYRKILKNLTSQNDILIFPSVELMIYAPRKRFVLWHFHYNSHSYFNFASRLYRLFARKPDSYIFLTDATKDATHPKCKYQPVSILNPSRFKRELNTTFHNNTLMSACRLESQKDPMMLVKIAKELQSRNFPCTFNIFGKGSFKPKMEQYVEDHCLQNVHFIEGITDLTPFYLSSDLFIITSKFEGLPLSTIEATSLSLPVIRGEMGDPTSSFMIEGENGFVITNKTPQKFADKIIETLSDKKRLESLKESTFKSSLRFDELEIKNLRIKHLNNYFKNL